MTTANLTDRAVSLTPNGTPRPAHGSAYALGKEIAELAARLHAGTYELLVLLREFDARTGWSHGFASCAHWLHWRTGIDLGAAREKVRVAHAVATLPRVSATMQRGAISYAKVRALTRWPRPTTKPRCWTSHRPAPLPRSNAWSARARRVDDVAAAQEESRHLNRQLATWVDDDGMVVIRGRLTPEVGAVVQRALETAADRLFQVARDLPKPEQLGEEVTPAQRRADALGLLAEAVLTADLDRGCAGDRYQVVLHLEMSTSVAAGEGLSGTMEVDQGVVDVSAETSRRISCDASLVPMRHDGHSAVLDVGRKTRTVPALIRRALQARDRSCRFPGCTSRRCDAHHVEHWVDGGPTSLDNLVRLCRRHHRAVHEGGFHLIQQADGAAVFLHPDGRELEPAPSLPRATARVEPQACAFAAIPVWDGTAFDLVYAVDVLYTPRVTNAEVPPN
jgi:hypothetical protein